MFEINETNFFSEKGETIAQFTQTQLTDVAQSPKDFKK